MDRFTDADYPAVPYPGTRPVWSYVHDEGAGYPLDRIDGQWLVRPAGEALDDWLAARNAALMADRLPILSYGSNANPAKLTWLRETLGLPGPAVVFRARCAGLAAVWASGLRVVDDQRPATLCARPGVVEQHAILMATAEQLQVLDVCEGRGERYHLAELPDADVTVAGEPVPGLLAYIGAGSVRMPLLVDGEPVRCADVAQAEAQGLVGVPAPDHGLRAVVLDN
jgi:hypothetical protein